MPKANQGNSELKGNVIVALIGLAGIIAAAIIANWDKLTPDTKNAPQHVQTKPINQDSINQAKARDIVIDIIGQTYRRAFALNFTTRFVKRSEYISVLKSINEVHGEVQSRYVELHSLKNSDYSTIVHNLLLKLDAMETTFQRMEPFISDNNFDSGYLPRRLDGSGPPELTAAFDDMESIRLRFIEDIRQLADKVNIVLPDVPVQVTQWGRPVK